MLNRDDSSKQSYGDSSKGTIFARAWQYYQSMQIEGKQSTWTLSKQLIDGEGGFGKVYEVHGRDGAAGAAKFVPKEPGADRELLIGDSFKTSDSTHVIPILDEAEDEDSWILIMPLAERSLEQHLQQSEGSLELEESISILTDIASALVEIEPVIVHRDLKPANILFYNGRWMLADFGISRYAEASTAADTRKYSFTRQYAAPEQWRSEHASSATDVYAFGVIAYQMLSGKLPFAGPRTEDFRQQHVSMDPPVLKAGTLRLQTLVEECLYKASGARPKPKNILKRLQIAGEDSEIPALSRLASVNRAIVRQRAADIQKASRKQDEQKLRDEMYTSALSSFQRFVSQLLQKIKENAPTAIIENYPISKCPPTGFEDLAPAARLGLGYLHVDYPSKTQSWDGPFKVLAYTSIRVIMTQDEDQRKSIGRSHSLWYCDAQTQGEFGWYELAFMGNPLMWSKQSEEPFSCSPPQGERAFLPAIDEIQLAWAPEEIDGDDPSEFIVRWIDWFAQAANGEFHRPSTLPEKQMTQKWRS